MVAVIVLILIIGLKDSNKAKGFAWKEFIGTVALAAAMSLSYFLEIKYLNF